MTTALDFRDIKCNVKFKQNIILKLGIFAL